MLSWSTLYLTIRQSICDVIVLIFSYLLKLDIVHLFDTDQRECLIAYTGVQISCNFISYLNIDLKCRNVDDVYINLSALYIFIKYDYHTL